jgi:hypothetical protein
VHATAEPAAVSGCRWTRSARSRCAGRGSARWRSPAAARTRASRSANYLV